MNGHPLGVPGMALATYHVFLLDKTTFLAELTKTFPRLGKRLEEFLVIPPDKPEKQQNVTCSGRKQNT